jgi:O-succinylbenzoate synthase
VRIERLELRQLKLPLVHFFETSFGRIHTKQFIVVKVQEGRAYGYGECVAEADPYYAAETNETVWHIIGDFIAPRVLGVDFSHPREVIAALHAIRGHNMAKAVVEMAAWDLFARQRGEPLWRTLGGTRDRIASGVSIGIQNSLEDLVDRVGRELRAGYRRIKIKIKPGWDVRAIEAIRDRFGPIPLMVDANAAYSLGDADRLRVLDGFDLMMIEQPLDHDDILDHAALQRRLRTAICLDESIKTAKRAHEAIAAGACRVVNIKPGRVGGFAESIRIHDLCAEHGVPVWHGGMLESGIGRAANIHLSTLRNFSLPGDVAASERYFDPDLIDPPIVVAADGIIAVPTGPGLGVVVREDRLDAATVRHKAFQEADHDSSVSAQASGCRSG